MLKFISFGSGSSGNCYYLFTENEGVLIDTGIGVRALKKYFHNYGLLLPSITNIIITHDHADHIKSVGSLSRDFHLPVYATMKVHQGIERNYSVRCKVVPERKKVIEKNVPFQIGEMKITPFDVPHDSLDCVGYKIEYGDVTFCLITDAGYVTDEMKQVIGDANYLVLEANHDDEMLMHGAYPQHLKTRIMSMTGHLSNADCGKALAENATEKLRHVWLCHLSEENNHPELARKTVEQVLRSHGIVAGADFKLEVLKRKIPSEIYEL